VPLNIKDPETDALARRLALMTGETITDALRSAIEMRLQHVQRSAAPKRDLTDIIDRGRRRATLDHRSDDDILGYGPDGLPS
jgi:antitoxin VapB